MIPASRAGERGSISILFAVVLAFLLVGFLALVIDVGHFYVVRAELQNAADSSALAGARDLDGTTGKFGVALQSAQAYSIAHQANGTPVEVPAADVSLGRWDIAGRAFVVTQTPAPQVNAVRVVTRRSAATGNPVATFFASTFGVTQQDITATSIALGGSPKSACGFPLAVPDCSLYDSAGNLRCDSTLTFGDGTTDSAAFTLMSMANPNTTDIDCAMACVLGYTPLPKSCPCNSRCMETSIENGPIKISNGNNFSTNMVNYINAVVAGEPGGTLLVQVPVVKTSLTSNCARFVLSGDQVIVGYAQMRLTGATQGPPKSLAAKVDCGHAGLGTLAQGFFGYKSSNVFTVQ